MLQSNARDRSTVFQRLLYHPTTLHRAPSTTRTRNQHTAYINVNHPHIIASDEYHVHAAKTGRLLITEVPRRRTKAETTIGIDLGDVWSHYCTLNQDGEVVNRGRFTTTPKAIEKWFTDVPSARVAMEAGTHSISQQLEELGS